MAQSTSSTELHKLLKRLQTGDAAAQRELIRRACDRLRRLAGKLLPDAPLRHEGPDEAMEHAVLRLERALEAVPPGSALRFFACAGAETRHELLKLMRHVNDLNGNAATPISGKPSSTSVSSPDPSATGPETTPEPPHRVRQIDCHACIELLPAAERECFDLLWYAALDQEEAAGALGISLATLKRRWMSARLQLLDLFHEQAS